MLLHLRTLNAPLISEEMDLQSTVMKQKEYVLDAYPCMKASRHKCELSIAKELPKAAIMAGKSMRGRKSQAGAFLRSKNGSSGVPTAFFTVAQPKVVCSSFLSVESAVGSRSRKSKGSSIMPETGDSYSRLHFLRRTLCAAFWQVKNQQGVQFAQNASDKRKFQGAS